MSVCMDWRWPSLSSVFPCSPMLALWRKSARQNVPRQREGLDCPCWGSAPLCVQCCAFAVPSRKGSGLCRWEKQFSSDEAGAALLAKAASDSALREPEAAPMQGCFLSYVPEDVWRNILFSLEPLELAVLRRASPGQTFWSPD